MILKLGVSVALATPAMQEAGEKIAGCYAAIGCACVVTSGDERNTLHRGKPVVGGQEDPHYEGLAWDFRIWNVPEEDREALVAKIREVLGPEFVVIFEDPHGANMHLHVQHGSISVA